MKFRVLGLYIGFTLSTIISLALAYNLNFEPLLSLILAFCTTYLCIYVAWYIGKYADNRVNNQGKENDDGK